MYWVKLKRFLSFGTAGWIAMSGLLICALSGIILIIPYDVTRPYRSVAEMLLLDPSGTFIRNLHYWSAQLVFIFTFLHIYDHLRKSTETNISNRRTWFILCLVAGTLGYEMISGFILKGDASGSQAHRIIAALLESVPLAGKMLKATFTGSPDNLQVVYLQHVATGTIILIIGIYDHVKTIWPKLKWFVHVLLILVCISLIFRAPLGQIESNHIKGPWFFVGIQEILHLTSHPVQVVLFFFLVFISLFFLPWLRTGYRNIMKQVLFAGCVVYLLLTLLVLCFRGDNWQWQGWREVAKDGQPLFTVDLVNIWSIRDSLTIPGTQKPEGCLVCHGSMKGFTDSHNPSVTGCFACHKGDPFSSDKKAAHRRMVKVPGDFSNVRQTCGTLNCHPEITGRILNSLMTTQSGIIGVDKFVFKESITPDDSFHIKNLAYTSADTHLRNLCAGCHLGKVKSRTGPAEWLERGGGCNACHLKYSDEAVESMKRMQSGSGGTKIEIHPAIDLQVSNDRCLSCHSRSGRISLNYEGWNETDLSPSSVPDDKHYRKLPDDRILAFVQADVHHQKGMACIDCHISYEIMGSGRHQVHKEDAMETGCADCHPAGKINSMPMTDLPDFESQMISALRNYNRKNKVIVTQNRQYPLLNTYLDSAGQIILTDKLNGKSHVSKPAAAICVKGKGHSGLSCESCHTGWVPQCIGCHNAYEKETRGFDLLKGRPVTGTWVEYAGKSMAEAPALGINTKKDRKVIPVMPGMIMTIDHGSFSKKTGISFHRLYAPASGHTTLREGRSCKSCHNNPLAIGYGRGQLTYRILGKEGKWFFEPLFTLNPNDNLPEDAWTGFLKEAVSPFSTRSTLRPFTVSEQKKILEVGACLTCHEEKSKTMDQALENFQQTLSRVSKHCILPE